MPGSVAILGCVIVNVLLIGHMKAFGVYLELLMTAFQEPASRVAWILALQLTTYTATAPMAKSLVDSFGLRRIGLFGALTGSLGLMLSATANQLEVLYVTLGIMQGLSISLTFIPGVVTLSRYFPTRRGLVNGLIMAGNALGGMILPLLANYLTEEYQLSGGFLIMGAILLHSCAGILLWSQVEFGHQPTKPVNNSVDQRTRNTIEPFRMTRFLQDRYLPEKFQGSLSCSGVVLEVHNSSTIEIDQLEDSNEVWAEIVAVLRSRMFYILTGSLLFHQLGHPGFQAYLPMRGIALGLSRRQGASLLSAVAVSDLIGRVTCGWLSDWPLMPRKYWFMGGMITSGVVALLMPLTRNYAGLLMGSVAFGLSSGAYIGLFLALTGDHFGVAKVAMPCSMSMMFSGVMALAGPPTLGYVLEKMQSYPVLVTIVGCAQLMGGFLWLLEPMAKRLDKKHFVVIHDDEKNGNAYPPAAK